MRQVFFCAFLLVAYCALVIAPTTSGDVPSTAGDVPSTSGDVPSTSGDVPSTAGHAPTTSGHVPSTSEIYKVEVIDFMWKDLYNIISFNTPHVSVADLWNNIYQIPDIARRRSESVDNHIYVQLTILTPGQPFIKINNETSAASNTNIYVADSVFLLSVRHEESHVIYITKDESAGQSKKLFFNFKWQKSKTSGKALVPGKKTILLDFIRTDSTTQTHYHIWIAAEWPITNWSADVSVWHNVDKIRVKACDRKGKVTTDKLLKKSRQSNQKLNIENGVIYVDLEHTSRPGSEAGVRHIVPLWIIPFGLGKGYYVGVFRFTESMTKRSIWQKLQSHLSQSSRYRTSTLVEVRIEMNGIENLVITENDVNGTSSPVNFENAIAVVFTVRENPIFQQDLLNNPQIHGMPEEKLESLPRIGATQEMANKKCVICLEEIKEKEELTQLPCDHLFHPQCAKRWLELKAECPLCRKDLSNWDFNGKGSN